MTSAHVDTPDIDLNEVVNVWLAEYPWMHRVLCAWAAKPTWETGQMHTWLASNELYATPATFLALPNWFGCIHRSPNHNFWLQTDTFVGHQDGLIYVRGLFSPGWDMCKGGLWGAQHRTSPLCWPFSQSYTPFREVGTPPNQLNIQAPKLHKYQPVPILVGLCLPKRKTTTVWKKICGPGLLFLGWNQRAEGKLRQKATMWLAHGHIGKIWQSQKLNTPRYPKSQSPGLITSSSLLVLKNAGEGDRSEP